MARKTVITKVLDVEAQDGIIEFPQNRALYADQFTDEAPNTDEEREGFKPKSMKDVFEHYQPSKKGVTMETEAGGAVYEDFDFKQLKDFEDEQLIAQSDLMGAAKGKKTTLTACASCKLKDVCQKPEKNSAKKCADKVAQVKNTQ